MHGSQQRLSLVFFCDKCGKSQPGTDFLKNKNYVSYLLIDNFYLLNIYFPFIYLFSLQYNIQCSHSDETLTNRIPGYLQIIITDTIRLTIIMKYGYGLSSPYSLLTLV